MRPGHVDVNVRQGIILLRGLTLGFGAFIVAERPSVKLGGHGLPVASVDCFIMEVAESVIARIPSRNGWRFEEVGIFPIGVSEPVRIVPLLIYGDCLLDQLLCR